VKWLDGEQRADSKGWSGVVWFVRGEMAGWLAKGGTDRDGLGSFEGLLGRMNGGTEENHEALRLI
jgi:hypothetical protein